MKKMNISWFVVSALTCSFAFAQAPVMIDGVYHLHATETKITSSFRCHNNQWRSLRSVQRVEDRNVDYSVKHSPNGMFVYGGVDGFQDMLSVETDLLGCQIVRGKFTTAESESQYGFQAISSLPVIHGVPAACGSRDSIIIKKSQDFSERLRNNCQSGQEYTTFQTVIVAPL